MSGITEKYQREKHFSFDEEIPICFFSILHLLVKDRTLFFSALLSQAASCDGLVYSINYNGQKAGTQGYTLPSFEDQTD